MVDPRRRAWAGYVRQVADALRLRDWTMVVRDVGPDDGDALASCHCVYGRKRALISLSDGFLDEPAEVQRHAVAHEVLHCHWDDAYYFAINRMAGEAEKEAYNRFVEKAIDGLADAIAPLLPMPGAAESGLFDDEAPPGMCCQDCKEAAGSARILALFYDRMMGGYVHLCQRCWNARETRR